jgi:uncharacterized repeat protein (TIGR01451 family)
MYNSPFVTRIFSFFVFLILSATISAQVTSVKYAIEYNKVKNVHDVFLIIVEGEAIKQLDRTQFNAQMSLVAPLGTQLEMIQSYNPISTLTATPCEWRIANVLNNTYVDATFFSISPTLNPTSRYSEVKSGDRVKLFSLKTEVLLCDGQLRLFENGTDPSSDQIGMAGGDFSNAFTIGGIDDKYIGNEIIPTTGCPSLIQYFLYTDIDNNGKYDGDDTPLPYLKMEIPSISTTLTSDINGNIKLYTAPGEYPVQFEAWYGLWVNNSPLTIAKVTDHTTFDTLRFIPLAQSSNTMSTLSTTLLRCNTMSTIKPSIQNRSSQPFSGEITATLDSRTTIIDVYPAPTSTAGHVMTWKVTNLPPGNYFKPHIFVRAPQAESNTDSLYFKTTTHDQFARESSSFEYADIILCSFDPNDKRVWPNRKGETNLTLNSEALRYTIRFQNNGNDTAFTVKIIDVLDKNFDLGTLDIIDASHEVNPILKGDTIFFVFDPILLPDSTTNYVGSQGFVTYGIKLLPNVSDNTKIRNTASIIFDQNKPIVTNTTLNTILEALPCPSEAIWKENQEIKVNQEANEYKWYECNTDQFVIYPDKIRQILLPHYR